MPVNSSNGVLEGRFKVSELISYLKGHMDIYGDTEVRFMLSGDEDVQVQFEHYKNAIVIDLYEHN